MKILQCTNTMSSELLTKMEARSSIYKGSEIPLQNTSVSCIVTFII